MANKRNLKKQIKYICGDLAGECIVAKHFIPGIDEAKMNEVAFEIASLQTTSIMRVSFSFDKVVADYESKKAYNIAKSKYFAEAYKKLISDFNQGVQSIVSKMNHALPAEQKEANKKNLAK